MRLLIILPIIVLAGCAARTSHKHGLTSAVHDTGLPTNSSGLRTGEQLKEYRFGRYVDPAYPLLMHECHPVYRVEVSPSWILAPNAGDMPVPHAAIAPVNTSTSDAVVAEVNKQRAATRAFTDETATLNQRLADMAQAVAQTRDLTKQSLDLQREIAAIRDRLDSLDSQIHTSKPAPPNSTPASADKW